MALLEDIADVLGPGGFLWVARGASPAFSPHLGGISEVSSVVEGGIHLPSGLILPTFNSATAVASFGDNAAFSPGSATADAPFSLGIFAIPFEITAARSLVAKYDSAGTLREYDFRIASTGKLQLELYDESADTTEIATGNTVLPLWKMKFLCATYDGGETSPIVNLYIDSVLDNDGSTVETGAYVAMENTTAPLLVGARGVAATPLQLWKGQIPLAFLTNIELTPAQVAQIDRAGSQLVGL